MKGLVLATTGEPRFSYRFGSRDMLGQTHPKTTVGDGSQDRGRQGTKALGSSGREACRLVGRLCTTVTDIKSTAERVQRFLNGLVASVASVASVAAVAASVAYLH